MIPNQCDLKGESLLLSFWVNMQCIVASVILAAAAAAFPHCVDALLLPR